ncbi:MAG: glycosyltransferase family 2 protein [Deltaproteobacteria bacterium]|nr:glycosyltransferase family 2 protein [Deltaproteobacteria bacterium]
MDIFFLICCFFVVYPYAVYPVVVRLLAFFVRKRWSTGSITPAVSVIISAYNEESIIVEKVRNTLECDYPPECLEVIVVSDGSTDGTVDAMVQIHDPQVVLKAYENRAGKTACLNRMVPAARGEILLFTDANSMFPRDLLKKTARNFHDESIGLVTGWTQYRSPDGREEATGAYSRLEKITKRWESLISSCVGADGAVFAMRKSLYSPMGPDEINDFVLPLRVIAQGKRVVLDPEVYCMEKSAGNEGKEFRRQARITNRTIRALAAHIHLLNPLRFGSFSFLLLSHKLLRFLAPFWVMGALLSSLVLASQSWYYKILLIGEISVLTLTIRALFHRTENRLIQMARTFLITLAAQSLGWWRFLRGRTDTMWTPQR